MSDINLSVSPSGGNNDHIRGEKCQFSHLFWIEPRVEHDENDYVGMNMMTMILSRMLVMFMVAVSEIHCIERLNITL